MIPYIDYDNFTSNYLPPSKRKIKFYSWLSGCISQVKWLFLNFWDYCFGSYYLYYDITATYNAGDKVILGFTVAYGGFGVYQSLVGGNLANIPNRVPPFYNSSNTYLVGEVVIHESNYYQCIINVSSPETFDPAKWNQIPAPGAWIKLNDNFVGASERSKYSFNKLVFEYALNRYFNTTFRNPTSWDGSGVFYTPPSDIYIKTNVPSYTSFVCGGLVPSFSFDSYSTGFISDTTTYIASSVFSFTVYIPSATYTALGTTREQIVRSVVDKYNLSGITYSIQSY